MPYQPGPFLLQDAVIVGFIPKKYDFTGSADDALSDIDVTLQNWDGYLFDAGSVLDGPADPFPDVDLNSAIDMLNAYSDPAAEMGLNAIVDALGQSNVGLGQAIGFAPAEAWYDASSTFVPPVPAQTIIAPVIPPGSINFTVEGAVDNGTGLLGGGAALPGPSVVLTNLTAYANPNFTVGDQFQVTATGVNGQTVYVYAVKDGVDIGGGPVGSIGADGKFTLTGQMDFTSVGVWQEEWWVGQFKIATFSFLVLND